MNAELWRRAEELFHAALAMPHKARAAFLDDRCGADLELRRHIELLLSGDEKAGSFLNQVAVTDVTATIRDAGSLVGQQLGHYLILSRLGVGGMGEVYRARDTKLGRDVAIKTLPSEFARDAGRVARFRGEARTLASLNHPNICAIHGLESMARRIFWYWTWWKASSCKVRFRCRKPCAWPSRSQMR